VATILIPAGDSMPSAGEVDVSGALLDRVVAAVPSLAAALTTILGSHLDDEDLGPWLAGLSTGDPAGFRSLSLAVAGAYYLDPGVRHRLGYQGQSSESVRVTAFPEYVEEGLLEPVLANWGA
jgi:hypothetical protein